MSLTTACRLALAATLALAQGAAVAQVRTGPSFTIVRTLATPLLSEPGRPSSDVNISGTLAYTQSTDTDLHIEGQYRQGTSNVDFDFHSGRTLTPACAGMSTVTITGSRAGRMSGMGTYAATAFLALSPSNSASQLGLVLAADTVAGVLCPAFAGSGVSTEAVAINAYQMVVGTTRHDRTTVATRWMLNWGSSSAGTPIDLSAVAAATAGGAFPAAINRYGTVVGIGLPSFASPSQGVWMKREGAPAVALFSPTTQRPRVAALNDRGVVVGTLGSRAWVFQPDVPNGLVNLPTTAAGLVTQAFGINNNDTIVGSCDGKPCYWQAVNCVTQASPPARQCSWTAPRIVGLLLPKGVVFTQAVAITDTDITHPDEHMLIEGTTGGGRGFGAWLVRKSVN